MIVELVAEHRHHDVESLEVTDEIGSDRIDVDRRRIEAHPSKSSTTRSTETSADTTATYWCERAHVSRVERHPLNPIARSRRTCYVPIGAVLQPGGQHWRCGMTHHRPVDEWPLIICGPMLRRVTPQSVTVFVALREPRDVHLYIFQNPHSTVRTIVATGNGPTVPLGERLHVAAITATPIAGTTSLDLGHLYGYDVTMFDASGLAENLTTLGLLGGALPLGYEPGWVPSFSLPKDMATANLVHGSCRKPHGQGHDLLPRLDDWIEEVYTDPDARPHTLFMTGDQIYADDVCMSVAAVIRSLQPDLIGWPTAEIVTSIDGSTDYSWDHADMRPGNPRGTTVLRESKSTSKEVDGHLVFLGEYLAMYALVWSDVLWPRSQLNSPGVPPPPQTLDDDLAVGTSQWPFSERFGTRRVRAERSGSSAHVTALSDEWLRHQRAFSFTHVTPYVRRALANVSTLTIFDDHDVTDDWNLNRRWRTDVPATPMGRTIVRNALVAYSFFQDWGNRPEYYASGAPGAALHDAARYTPATATAPAQNPPLGATTFDLVDANGSTTPNSHAAGRLEWHWTVDLAPLKLRFRALDGRTRRFYPPGNADAGAGLLVGADLATQAPVPTGDAPLDIVLAPAPILGVPFWEEFLQRIIVDWKGAAYGDNEPWAGHRETFEALLDHLAEFGSVVVLSGDVHFAHTCEAAWFGGTVASPTHRGRIVQLNCSGLKNQDLEHQALGSLGHQPNEAETEMQLDWLGWSSLPAGVAADLKSRFDNDLDAWSKSDRPSNEFRHLGLWALTALAPRKLEAEAWREWFRHSIGDRADPPAVLPLSGWPGPTTQQLIAQHAPAAEWAYRVTYLRDDRDDARREREVVGSNNIARITFDVDAADRPTHVVHRIHQWRIGVGTDVTEHRAPLAPPDLADRPTP